MCVGCVVVAVRTTSLCTVCTRAASFTRMRMASTGETRLATGRYGSHGWARGMAVVVVFTRAWITRS